MRRDSGFADLTFADLAFADLAFADLAFADLAFAAWDLRLGICGLGFDLTLRDPRARAGNGGFCNGGQSSRAQIRHGIFFTGLGSSPNTFAAVPPRMLRRPLSLRNGRS
jgi:hypothetical protein